MEDIISVDISRYYDVLHLWTRFNKGFQAFSGFEANTIHRWLTDPETGEFSPSTIHNIMLSIGIGDDGPIDALDAGCGYGGTMFALHNMLGGLWHGTTISRRQWAVGRKAALKKAVANAVTFSLGSYDRPPPRSYNFIYGIESLIHSINPSQTISNLARALRPGGTFAIVDDMPADRVSGTHRNELARFKKLWRCPVMPTAAQWCAGLEKAGCEVVEVRDLSPLMRPRSEHETSQAIKEVHARRRWRDLLGLRRVGEAEIGGLLLERLGGAGIVSYKLIVARKRC